MKQENKDALLEIASHMAGGLVEYSCGHCGTEVNDLTRKRCGQCRHQLPRTNRNR